VSGVALGLLVGLAMLAVASAADTPTDPARPTVPVSATTDHPGGPR
jgi:hypothetical protein